MFSSPAATGATLISRVFCEPEGWTRAEADLMFLCFLIEDGLAVPRALAAYAAVRVCGRKAWNDNRKLLEGA